MVINVTINDTKSERLLSFLECNFVTWLHFTETEKKIVLVEHAKTREKWAPNNMRHGVLAKDRMEGHCFTVLVTFASAIAKATVLVLIITKGLLSVPLLSKAAIVIIIVEINYT